jgi:lipoyl(octanoyl) transferase
VNLEIHRHTSQAPWTYADLDRRQEEIYQKLVANPQAHGSLLLSEVAPVITTGKRDVSDDFLLSPAELARQGVSLYPCERGGRATYHGPGQWVLFAVERLEALTGDRRGVRKAICGLLEIAREVGQLYDPRAEIRSDAETGVWLPEGKFAAVGVKIRDGILLHGLSLNGFKTPLSFKGLRPCGLDLPVSYLLPAGDGSAAESDEDRNRRFNRLGQQLVAAAREKFQLS